LPESLKVARLVPASRWIFFEAWTFMPTTWGQSVPPGSKRTADQKRAIPSVRNDRSLLSAFSAFGPRLISVV
jgi:hypothetical protein